MAGHGVIVEASRDAANGGETLRRVAYFVQQLWRYPVKSMAGESLERAERCSPTGSPATGSSSSKARTASSRRARGRSCSPCTRCSSAAGEPLVEHLPVGQTHVAKLVQMVAGPDAELTLLTTSDRFDVLPLLVATDGAIKAFGRDGRRLRPNLVLGGVEGLAERDWEGARLKIGDAVIRLDSLRARCVMTTFHPDTLEQDVERAAATSTPASAARSR